MFRDPELMGNVEEFCAPPPPPGEDIMEALPCSAAHTSCYISPYGDVFPCVQFPLPTGNVRRQKFIDIWRGSPEMAEVRSIRAKDLPVCSTCSHVGTCTRCPGLAYMEGNMCGPSTADCEKSLLRTGMPTANMLAEIAAAQPHSPGTDSPRRCVRLVPASKLSDSFYRNYSSKLLLTGSPPDYRIISL